MSFLYPRTIRILRPRAPRTFGAGEYSGADRAREECIAEAIPAAIQLKKETMEPPAKLPGDTARRTFWTILIPRQALPSDVTVRLRDIIEDDAKMRYQVTAPYMTALGYQLFAELLEV